MKFEKWYSVHGLRKYWTSPVAMQGMDAKVVIEVFGHGDFDLNLKTYYAQNDDPRLVEDARKVNFGLEQSEIEAEEQKGT